MSGCFNTAHCQCDSCRLNKLEEHKKYQVDENRKVSKRLDELGIEVELCSKFSMTQDVFDEHHRRIKDIEYRLCHIVDLPTELDIRLQDVERKIDNMGTNVGKLRKELESNQLGKQLDQQVWKFLTERIDKLEGSLFHEQMCRQELGNKIDKLEERLAHTEADMNHIPSFEYIDGLKKSLDNSFRELKFRTETERDLDDTMWEVDRIKKSSENHADRLNVIEDYLDRLADNSPKPHKCPVCDGKTKIELLTVNEQFTNNGYRYKDCSSCEGKGIIWG